MQHLALTAIDVTDPENPVFPTGLENFDVSKYIVSMEYNPQDYYLPDTSLDRLRYRSDYTARVSYQAGRLNQFVQDIRSHMAKGRYVLVRGWKPAVEMAWDETAVLSFKGPLEQRVEYQGSDNASPLLNMKLNSPL